jgi:hypothetical protein
LVRGEEMWSGFTWLRIGTVGGLSWMRRWTFRFWRHGVSSVILLLQWRIIPRRYSKLRRKPHHSFTI